MKKKMKRIRKLYYHFKHSPMLVQVHKVQQIRFSLRLQPVLALMETMMIVIQAVRLMMTKMMTLHHPAMIAMIWMMT